MSAISVYVHLLVFVILVLLPESLAYYQGRHVCSERKKIQHPVPVTQSYRRPVYRKDLGKVVYVTAHKTVFKLQMRTQVYRSCCKGWAKRVPREAGCLAPVCKEKCMNGGHCIAPDLCMCAEGYAGYKCQIDINECAGRHQCQQRCINLPGTYECACQQGFVLADDEMNCDLCLSCTKEFKAMQAHIGNMSKQISHLEQERQTLQNNLTLALGQYEVALSKIEKMEETNAQKLVTPKQPTTTESAYVIKDKLIPLDRLASLSEQISILEERMADCACNPWYK